MPPANDFIADTTQYNVLRRWDMDSDEMEWDFSSTRTAELLLAYNSSKVGRTSRWWKERIHGDDRERVLQSLQRCIDDSNQRFWCEDYRFLTDLGDYLTVIDQLHVHRDEGGRALRAIGSIFNPQQRCQLDRILRTDRHHLLEDISLSAKKQMSRREQDELRYQSHLIKTITDNITSCLFMMDAKGHPTFLNPAAERVTGYTLAEIKDRPLHYAIHYMYPDGRPYPMEECPVDNSHAALLSVHNQEEVFADKAGRLFPVVWSVAPLEKDGKTVGAVIEFRDVTEEKRKESERLAAEVRAEQQRILATEANERKRIITEFVDYLCHEIRNPLHGIAANADFLSQAQQTLSNLTQSGTSLEQLVKSIGDYIRSIQECVHHQSVIMNGVLDLSRLEAGKVEVMEHVFRLSDVVDQALAIFNARIAENDLTVITDVALCKDLLVKGDSTLYRQILLNLLSNAIKFTPPNGEVTIQLEAPIASDSRLLVAATVRDNGPGVPEEKRSKLFQRFSQLNQNFSSAYGGSGLGLSICFQLTKLMGGSVWLLPSPEGQGAAFSFSVSFAIPSQSEIQKYLLQKSVTINGSSCLQKNPTATRFKDILVVEDNIINQKIMARFLNRLEYTFSLASNGEEALKAFTANGLDYFDCVIMDMEMPVMDGKTATKKIRELGATVPIIALSGNSRKEQIDVARECGLNDYLTKPCNQKLLQAVLEKWETIKLT